MYQVASLRAALSLILAVAASAPWASPLSLALIAAFRLASSPALSAYSRSGFSTETKSISGGRAPCIGMATRFGLGSGQGTSTVLTWPGWDPGLASRSLAWLAFVVGALVM